MALLNVRIGGANPILLGGVRLRLRPLGRAVRTLAGRRAHGRRRDHPPQQQAIRSVDRRHQRASRLRAAHPDHRVRDTSWTRACVGPGRQPARTRPRLRVEAGLHPAVVVERPARLDRRLGVVARRQQHRLGHTRRHRHAGRLRLQCDDGGGTSSAGLRSKNPTGTSEKPVDSTGMTGQSSGRTRWVTPKVCHTTISVSSIGRSCSVHTANPSSPLLWLGCSPAARRSVGLVGRDPQVVPAERGSP